MLATLLTLLTSSAAATIALSPSDDFISFTSRGNLVSATVSDAHGKQL